MAIATFAAGCFWGVEMAFRRVKGVRTTAVGYSGGSVADPSYELVCTGRSGHAEVVRVEFDPEQVGYGELLDVFWQAHDPTQLNRQGPDVGKQYRSALYTHSDEQADAARRSLQAQQGSGRYRGTIVTEITPAGDFYMAEDYHQQYFEKRAQMAFLRR